jgi:hypothetical protein
LNKPVRFTRHAWLRMAQYALPERTVEAIVRTPEWSAPDAAPGVERRFGRSTELGGRTLRVVCVQEEDHIRVLSVFSDRDARRPDAP